MTEIRADFDTLLRQASMTAEDYLIKAIFSIDKRMGDGYAGKHPELVAAMVTAASTDFNHAMLKLCAQDILEAACALREGLSAMREGDA